MIKCCIFDLDGTILNTLETIRYYLNRTMTKYGRAPITEEECRLFVGAGARVLLTKAFNSRGGIDEKEFEVALSEYMADYDCDPYHLTEKYKGIDELIDELKKRKIKLAVLSNKPDFATRSAVGHFFGDSFNVVHGGRDGIPLKPSPEGCLEILSELSVLPSECVYIGDSDVDVMTGKNMNAALTVSVRWGFRTKEELNLSGAEHMVSSVDEICTLIDNFNKGEKK
ncbi:MAG: HAD family hydrolase [Clostridia bacterium]|nr:HAD family hydrolase [Clostridia bacterium]